MHALGNSIKGQFFLQDREPYEVTMVSGPYDLMVTLRLSMPWLDDFYDENSALYQTATRTVGYEVIETMPEVMAYLENERERKVHLTYVASFYFGKR